MLTSFEQIRDMVKSEGEAPKIGVVAAQDEHTLQAVSRAAAEGIISPILYGETEKIKMIWAECAPNTEVPEIVECMTIEECIASAIADVKNGTLCALMKGKLETGTLMKAVVNRETGIRKSSGLSMIAMVQSPYYHKLFCCTDIGLMTYPDVNQKKAIIENAVELFHTLGVECPKVGVLAAIEKVNPKMPETVAAAELKEMNLRGEISGCVVEGPISYDLCMDAEAAAIKGYESPVAGDPDILAVNDIAVGNCLIKSLTCTGGAESCGIVWGAQVPIVICSRASTANDKYMSIVLACATGMK